MSMKPKFDGPYIITAFNNDRTSATLEHMDTGFQLRAHFTNMTPINFHPSSNRLPTNFDDNIFTMDRDKYTLRSKSLRDLNIDLGDEEISQVQARFTENDQIIETDLADKNLTINGSKPNDPNFGRFIDNEYEDLKEHVRQTIVNNGQNDEQFNYSDTSDEETEHSENYFSEDDFNEEELLNEEERDLGSQLFRDYNDQISDTDNESDHEFKSQENTQDSNPHESRYD